MFVRDFMTKDPIAIPPQASITYTADLMKKHQLKRFPVVDKNKLVGLVTESDIMKSLPSPATSLSKHEINYLTSKITVADVMTTKVVTTSPDTTIEEALLVMRQHDFSCLPVVENGKLTGIITESNFFEALLNLLGLKRAGLRITIQVPDRTGVLADLTAIIKELQLPIISMAVFPEPETQTATVILRVATDNEQPILEKLQASEYKTIHWTFFPEHTNNK